MLKGEGSAKIGTEYPDRKDELLWSREEVNITDKKLDVYLQCTNHLPEDLALTILRNSDYNVSTAVEKCNGIQPISELSHLEQKVLLSITPAPWEEVELESRSERKTERHLHNKLLPHVPLSTIRDYYHHVGRDDCLPPSTKESHMRHLLKPAYDRLLRDKRILIEWESPYYLKPGQSRITRSSAFIPLHAMPRKIGRDNLAISMVGYSQKKPTKDYDSSPERDPLRTLPFNHDPFNRLTKEQSRRSGKGENTPKRRRTETPASVEPKRRGRPRKTSIDTSANSSPALVSTPSQPTTTVSPPAIPSRTDTAMNTSPVLVSTPSQPITTVSLLTIPSRTDTAMNTSPVLVSTPSQPIATVSPLTTLSRTDAAMNTSPVLVSTPSQHVKTISPLTIPSRSDIASNTSPLLVSTPSQPITTDTPQSRGNRSDKFSDASTIPYVSGKAVKKKPEGEEYTLSDALSGTQSPSLSDRRSTLESPTVEWHNMSPTVSEEENMERNRRTSERIERGEAMEEEENQTTNADEVLDTENMKSKRRSSARKDSGDNTHTTTNPSSQEVNSEEKNATVSQRLPAGTERNNQSFFSAAALAPNAERTNGHSLVDHSANSQIRSLFDINIDEIHTNEQMQLVRMPVDQARQRQPTMRSLMDVHVPPLPEYFPRMYGGEMMPTQRPNGNLTGMEEFLSRPRLEIPLPAQWGRTPQHPYCQGALRPAGVPRNRYSPSRHSRPSSRSNQRPSYPPPPPEI